MHLNGDGAAALLRFDVADYAGLIQPANVSSARFVFHLSKVKKAGDLKIQAVTSEWTEAAQGKRMSPALDATALSTIPSDAVIEDQYAIVDVTAQVKQWLASPASDFGLAVTCGPATNVQIATKEGVTTGHPAWLEIESHPLAGNEQIAAGVDAVKLGDGTVSNAEFAFLNGVLSPIQTQINTVISNADGKVSRTGDTMTGPLILPANGLKVGTNQLHVTEGLVGIGTSTPTAPLEVRGDIKLGTNGEYQAPAGEEKLKILQGNVLWEQAGVSVQSGKGFTVTHVADDVYRFTFDVPFSAVPSVMVNTASPTGGFNATVVRELTPAGFTVDLALGRIVQFIAVGAR